MYLLDANVFIQAKNLHYGFDFVPAFRNWLIRENSTGKVASVEKVADELRVGRDELSEWAEERGEGFFLRPDVNVATALNQVSDRASSQGYAPAAVATFFRLPTLGLLPMPRRTIAWWLHMKFRLRPSERSRFQTPASAWGFVASIHSRCFGRIGSGSYSAESEAGPLMQQSRSQRVSWGQGAAVHVRHRFGSPARSLPGPLQSTDKWRHGFGWPMYGS